MVAVVLATLGATTGVASALLTEEEMSTLRGGCSVQWYCIYAHCGSTVECNGYEGACEPGSEYPCNNTKESRVGIWHCAGTTPNGDPCARTGEVDACGPQATCYCKDATGSGGWECRTKDPRLGYQYFPCGL